MPIIPSKRMRAKIKRLIKFSSFNPPFPPFSKGGEGGNFVAIPFVIFYYIYGNSPQNFALQFKFFLFFLQKLADFYHNNIRKKHEEHIQNAQRTLGFQII
jgi:hypothetical protein